jgi:hypothetical protein
LIRAYTSPECCQPPPPPTNASPNHRPPVRALAATKPIIRTDTDLVNHLSVKLAIHIRDLPHPTSVVLWFIWWFLGLFGGQYKSILTQLMCYVQNRRYAKDHEFSTGELATLTPEHIYRWMCTKGYGMPSPTCYHSTAYFEWTSPFRYTVLSDEKKTGGTGVWWNDPSPYRQRRFYRNFGLGTVE